MKYRSLASIPSIITSSCYSHLLALHCLLLPGWMTLPVYNVFYSFPTMPICSTNIPMPIAPSHAVQKGSLRQRSLVLPAADWRQDWNRNGIFHRLILLWSLHGTDNGWLIPPILMQGLQTQRPMEAKPYYQVRQAWCSAAGRSSWAKLENICSCQGHSAPSYSCPGITGPALPDRTFFKALCRPPKDIGVLPV